jgi:uncharacterized protein YdeI (YjbR/CyaY-like superfamily)
MNSVARPARYFESAIAFRRWLERNHATTAELLVGFYKKASGKGGLTYPEAVDELLCFGWIDGVVRRVDDERYTHRITPRRTRSIWSKVNIRHVERLTAAGRMHAAGAAAFAARRPVTSGIYLYEKAGAGAGARKFPPALARIFRADAGAWRYWLAQPPGYRRTAIIWVTGAMKEETRQRRLQELIRGSAQGRRLLGK